MIDEIKILPERPDLLPSDLSVTSGKPPETPSTLDVISADIQKNNIPVNIGSAYIDAAYWSGTQHDPEYDPYSDMGGFEEYASELNSARNKEEMFFLKERIRQEESWNRTIASASGWQQAASAVSLIGSDPTIAIPLGGTLWKTYKTTGKILEGAARTAAYAAAISTGQEALLHHTQLTRTGEESANNIAGATLISALLGGVVAHIHPSEVAALGKRLEDDLTIPKEYPEQVRNPSEWGQEPIEVKPADVKSTVLSDGSIGAASHVKFTPAETEIAKTNPVFAATLWAYKKLPPFLQNPAMDMAVSISSKTREIGNKLADHSLVLNMHNMGMKGKTFGSSVETEIKSALGHLRLNDYHETEKLFKEYRNRVEQIIKTHGQLPPEERLGKSKTGAMSRDEFFKEVGKAARRGDKHPINEVAKSAAAKRKNVFSPLFERAKAVGFFKDMDESQVKTAQSYMTRVFNIPKILTERAKFFNIVRQDLADKEAAKTGFRLLSKDLHEKITDTVDRIKYYEKKVAQFQKRVDELGAVEEEASLMNKFAYSKSSKLSEPIDEVRGKIDGIRKSIQAALDHIENLSENIKEELGEFPELVDLQKKYRKISMSLSHISKHAELVDVIDTAEEIQVGLSELEVNFRQAMEHLQGQIKEVKASEAYSHIAQLEKDRARLKRAIKPFTDELKKLREQKAELEKTRKPLAKGGATFETKIRERHNKISDRLSGKEHTLEEFKGKLAAEEEKLSKLEDEGRSIVEDYKGKTAKQAKGAIKREALDNAVRSAEGKAALRTASKEVFDAVRRLARQSGKEPAELDGLAHEIIDNITKVTGGRLPYDLQSTSGGFNNVTKGTRGSMRQRTWDIEDAKIEEFLENDIGKIAERYMRTMVPDIEVQRAFGTLDINELKKQIQEDYNILRSKNPEKSTELTAMMERDMANVQASIEKLRGQYAQPDDYASGMHVAERALMAWNFASHLGDMVTSSIPDIGRHVMVNGLGNTFKYSFLAMIKDYKGLKMSASDARELLGASDIMTGDTARRGFYTDDYTPITGKIDEVGAKLSQYTAALSLMNRWNTAQKTFAGIITQSRMLKSIIKLGAGEDIDTKEATFLLKHGIGMPEAKEIAKLFSKYGEKRDVLNIPNVRLWNESQLEMAMREKFRAAMTHAVDETIVTPGLDKELWMSRPGLRMIGQFKSFSMSSMQRVTLAGLQQADAATLNGVLLSTFLGSQVYFMKSWLAGRKPSDKPAVWVTEGIDRSGVLGWLFEANNITEKITGGRIGVNRLIGGPVMSRYASRNSVGALLGPSYGQFTDLFNVTGSAFSDKWNGDDTHALRKMIPLQNVAYLRGIFDKIEEAANSYLGVANSKSVHSYGTDR